jgi:hypothetical protein
MPSRVLNVPSWLQKRNFTQFGMPQNTDTRNSVFSDEIRQKPGLNVNKINKDFENLLFNVKNKNHKKNNLDFFKKDTFSTCSDFNSNMIENMNASRAFANANKAFKPDYFYKGSNQVPKKPACLINSDFIKYSSVTVPEESREFKNSTELVLENSYFGEVDIKVKMQRKDVFRNLLNNLENTFYFEKNSTASLKNFLKMDTLQILIRPTVFKKLSFQMKLSFFVWYWVKLVEHKWFNKTFESLLPKHNITNIKFIQELTKEYLFFLN